jgi:hypothetical protein
VLDTFAKRRTGEPTEKADTAEVDDGQG